MGAEFNYEVETKLFSIDEQNGYSIQLNKIKWNGGEAKYDLRRWKDGNPLKGISMKEEVLNSLAVEMAKINNCMPDTSELGKAQLLKQVLKVEWGRNVKIDKIIQDTATYNYLRRNNVATLANLVDFLKNSEEESIKGFTERKKQIVYNSLEEYVTISRLLSTNKTEAPFMEIRDCYRNLPIDSLNVFLDERIIRNKMKPLSCQTIGDLANLSFEELKTVLDDELMIRIVEIERQLKNKPSKLISHVWNKKINSRNWSAAVKRSCGESLQSIGNAEGISRERVRQIVMKFFKWQEPFLLLVKNEIELASNKIEMLNKMFPREENRQLYKLWEETYCNSDYEIQGEICDSVRQLSLFEDGFLSDN